MGMFETSAKNNSNVSPAFQQLVEEIVAERQKNELTGVKEGLARYSANIRIDPAFHTSTATIDRKRRSNCKC